MLSSLRSLLEDNLELSKSLFSLLSFVVLLLVSFWQSFFSFSSLGVPVTLEWSGDTVSRSFNVFVPDFGRLMEEPTAS